MSAFDFVRPSGVWANEMVPGANDWRGWDWRQSRLINGDDGGTWNPTNPVTIGGAGLQLDSQASSLEGGFRTQLGGRLKLGKYDIPAYRPPRVIRRVVDILSIPTENIQFYEVPFTSRGGSPILYPASTALITLAPINGQTPGLIVALNLSPASITFTIPSEWILNGRVLSQPGVIPNLGNAQLASVALNFRYTENPGSLDSLLQVVPSSGVSATFPPISANGLQSAFGSGKYYPWLPYNIPSLGQYVRPQTRLAAPLSYFRCTTAGVSGVVEPSWNLTPGATTNDNSVVWTCIGPTGDLYAPDVAHLYNEGLPQSLVAAMDPVVSPNIDEAGNYVQVTVNNAFSTMILHSFTFTFADVNAMIWS
jgi:hypothetical protein